MTSPSNVHNFERILSIFLISEIVHLKLQGKLESQENEWYWGHGFRLFNYFHIHPQKHKLALLQMESSIISKIVSTKTLKVHRAENEEFKEKPEIIGLIGLKELVAKNSLIPSLQCWMNIYHRKYQIQPSHWSKKSEKYIAFSDKPEFLKSILNKQKPIFPPFLVVFSQFLMLCFHEKGFSHIWAKEPWSHACVFRSRLVIN